MEPLGWHITARLRDDRVIASDAISRRVAATVVLRAGQGSRLMAFRVVDTHVHALLATPRAEAGRFATRALGSLVQALDLPVRFEPARLRPVEDQRHLRNAFDYVLRNHRHHDVAGDTWHDASNLPDLLGLRTVGAHTIPVVRALLPRVTRDDLLAHLGVRELGLGPASPEHLAAAALAASGARSLSGRSVESVAARVAAAHTGLAAEETAAALGTTSRSIRRLRAAPPDRALVAAILRQCAWRADAPAPVEDFATVPLPTAPPPTAPPSSPRSALPA